MALSPEQKASLAAEVAPYLNRQAMIPTELADQIAAARVELAQLSTAGEPVLAQVKALASHDLFWLFRWLGAWESVELPAKPPGSSPVTIPVFPPATFHLGGCEISIPRGTEAIAATAVPVSVPACIASVLRSSGEIT